MKWQNVTFIEKGQSIVQLNVSTGNKVDMNHMILIVFDICEQYNKTHARRRLYEIFFVYCLWLKCGTRVIANQVCVLNMKIVENHQSFFFLQRNRRYVDARERKVWGALVKSFPSWITKLIATPKGVKCIWIFITIIDCRRWATSFSGHKVITWVGNDLSDEAMIFTQWSVALSSS